MDDTETLIEDCENREGKLTEWEVTFIDSLRRQFDKNGSITEKQRAVLDKIWERIT